MIFAFGHPLSGQFQEQSQTRLAKASFRDYCKGILVIVVMIVIMVTLIL
jgi:hypothetical protein